MAVLAARFGDSYRWMVTIPAMIGTIATILSSTIANVALPEIMGAYGMGQDHAQLVATAFLASVTGTMLLNGWLVDRFGFRLTYSAAMLIFIFGSLLSGFAPEEGTLILGRVLQGAAAGMVQPLGMQIILMVYPPEKRGSAMGLYAVGVVLAPALGPAFGGLMVDGFGWRSVFFLAIPFAMIGLILGLIVMPGPAREGTKRRFDAPGFILLIIALFALLTGLSSGQREGWQSDGACLAAGFPSRGTYRGQDGALAADWHWFDPFRLFHLAHGGCRHGYAVLDLGHLDSDRAHWLWHRHAQHECGRLAILAAAMGWAGFGRDQFRAAIWRGDGGKFAFHLSGTPNAALCPGADGNAGRTRQYRRLVAGC